MSVRRLFLLWLLIASFLLFCGCFDDDGGNNPVEVVISDSAFLLVENLSVVDIEPSQFILGSPLEFTVVCDCRYEGKGWISLVGHGGGHSVGIISSPLSGELGYLAHEVHIPEGELSVRFVLEPTTRSDLLAITVGVTCDSLLAGEGLVHWASEEGRNVYHGDIPPDSAFIFNGVGHRVTIPRAEN